MIVWDQGVEILRESIFAYAQACNGNLGAGILAVTFLARLALLPIGIRVARATLTHQRAMQRLQPELDQVRSKYKGQPQRVAEETRRVLTREGISAVPAAGCVGTLAQAPIFVALYASVRQAASVGGRFLWVRNLAQPDLFVAIAATLFTFMAAVSGNSAPAQNQCAMMLISTLVTIVALMKMSAGVALYWAMSSLFGAVQGFVVGRANRAHAA